MRAFLLACLVAVALASVRAEDERLSAVEQLQLDLHRTQIAYEQALSQGASCRAQLRELQLTTQQTLLKSTIEQAHPGYAVDIASGALSKLPPPPEAK